MSNALVDTLRGMVDAGGGWAVAAGDGSVLESASVVTALLESRLCATDYSALRVAGFVGGDVGWDVMTQAGRFTRRAREAIDQYILEYADGDSDFRAGRASYAFNKFRTLLGIAVGAAGMAGWGRGYSVVDASTAMRLGGQWSLHDHCWYREYKSSWGDVTRCGGLVIKGLWSEDGRPVRVDNGAHFLRLGGRSVSWAGLSCVNGSALCSGVRLIVMPLSSGGVWVFNFYRKGVGDVWDNGVFTRGRYSDKTLMGGGDLLMRDIAQLGGPDFVVRAVSGSTERGYINGGSSYVIVPQGTNIRAGDSLHGLRAWCSDVANPLILDHVHALGYNARLTSDGLGLCSDRWGGESESDGWYICGGCGERVRFSCDGCGDSDD